MLVTGPRRQDRHRGNYGQGRTGWSVVDRGKTSSRQAAKKSQLRFRFCACQAIENLGAKTETHVTNAPEPDDLPDDDPSASPLAIGEDEAGLPPAIGMDPKQRRPELDVEFREWVGLDIETCRQRLQEVIRAARPATAELLVHLCRRAHGETDRRTLNLAFEALSKVATPLLMSRAWGMTAEERREQVQQILLDVFVAIQNDTANYAEAYFAAFAKRKAISLYRARQARFEGAFERIEPTEEFDPLDDLPARIPSAEARALLAKAVDNLEPKHRTAFAQYHYLEMTQREIAAYHNVEERTVRHWLKKASTAVGLTGDEDGH